LKERYADDPSTHPNIDLDLWLEAGSSGGPDRNKMYGLSNTTIENLRTTHSVSTVGCSQSISSTQSLEFATLLDQGIQEHTSHHNEKYEPLSVNYGEPCLVVMKMRLQRGGICAPS